jgi:hypothetical protein
MWHALKCRSTVQYNNTEVKPNAVVTARLSESATVDLSRLVVCAEVPSKEVPLGRWPPGCRTPPPIPTASELLLPLQGPTRIGLLHQGRVTSPQQKACRHVQSGA